MVLDLEVFYIMGIIILSVGMVAVALILGFALCLANDSELSLADFLPVKAKVRVEEIDHIHEALDDIKIFMASTTEEIRALRKANQPSRTLGSI